MNQKLYALKEKYSNMSLAVRAGFWFTICNFLQRGITMITTPVFTRIMPEEQYGLVSTFFSWQNVLTMIVSLSLYKAMMNLYVKHDNKEKVLSAVCGLTILISSIWFAAYLIFHGYISDLMEMSVPLTFCLFISIIFSSVISCWSMYERYIYDYRRLIIVTLLITLLSSVLGVLSVIFISPSAESRLIPQTLVSVIVGIVVCFWVFKRDHTFYNKQMWVFSLTFCVPLLPHYLAEFVLQSSDRLMINYMCGSRDVAIYSIAYSVGSLITLVTSAINSSFAPFQYQKIQSKEYKKLAKAANEVLLFVGLALFALMLFGREIVLIFGGVKYIESIQVIIPICLGVYFNYLFQLFARVQEYYEHKLSVVIPSVLCAVLNIVLNFIFIRLCGYQAAAYTTFICYMVFCILHYFFYKRVCNRELGGVQLYNIKGIILISVLVIALGGIAAVLNEFIIVKYCVIAGCVILAICYRKRLMEYIKRILQKK